MKEPTPVTLSGNQYEQLILEIKKSNLSESTQTLVLGIIQLCLWMQTRLEKSKISISKLKRLFFIKTESRKKKDTKPETNNSCGPNSDEIKNALIPINNVETLTINNEDVKKRIGHGRRGADEYIETEHIEIEHPLYRVGDLCPIDGCSGKLSLSSPGIFIRIEGSNLFNVFRYETQKLRCALCGTLFTATLPDHIKSKYDFSAKALIAVMKYEMGVPWYRLAKWQQQIGAPIPESTQWELMVELYNCVAVVFNLLVTLAAQSKLFYQDDTTFKILEVIRENKDKDSAKERTGMLTTGIVAEHDNHLIYLFFSGTNHAGDNLSEVLTHRDPTLPAPLQMSDALSSNTVEKSFATIVCNCLVHGRRKFIDIESLYPKQSGVILDAISAIYKNEQYCKTHKLSPEARLAYHQGHSEKIMTNMKADMEEAIKTAEPNAPLAAAYKYFLKRWKTFTRFLTHVGAPLDTNIVERGLKLIIRVRKASLFYKTRRGALIGSQLVSIIQTALKSKVNPIKYLTALQEHSDEVAKNTYAWLPWNYEKTIKQLAIEQAA